MKIVLIIASLILFSGCVKKKLYVTEYNIAAEVLKTKSGESGCKDKSLKIAQAFSSASLMSQKMDYTESNNKIYSYAKAEWNESPNHSITLQVLKQVRDAGLFKSVQASKSRSKNSWILETNIEEFMQYYDKESHANVLITFTLIDFKTNDVIATETFSSSAKAKTLDADGGVEALNRALSDVLTQNIEWLSGVCK